MRGLLDIIADKAGYSDKKKFIVSLIIDAIIIALLLAILNEAKNFVCVKGTVPYSEYKAGNYTLLPDGRLIPASDLGNAPDQINISELIHNR